MLPGVWIPSMLFESPWKILWLHHHGVLTFGTWPVFSFLAPFRRRVPFFSECFWSAPRRDPTRCCVGRCICPLISEWLADFSVMWDGVVLQHHSMPWSSSPSASCFQITHVHVSEKPLAVFLVPALHVASCLSGAATVIYSAVCTISVSNTVFSGPRPILVDRFLLFFLFALCAICMCVCQEENKGSVYVIKILPCFFRCLRRKV